VVLENIHIPPPRRFAGNSAGQERGVQSHKFLWEGGGLKKSFFLEGVRCISMNTLLTVLPHVISCGIVKL